jgi:hypothetical protein
MCVVVVVVVKGGGTYTWWVVEKKSEVRLSSSCEDWSIYINSPFSGGFFISRQCSHL